MVTAQELLVRKFKEHSPLGKQAVAEIGDLKVNVRELRPGEDFIRQGDRPKAAALVLSGMVARYHLLEDGRRQYLSYHLPGDLPDAQGLFIDRMDHAVCAVGHATTAAIAHDELLAAFRRCPEFGFAVWRETLIDAAIFRNAITNNGSRPPLSRMAHLFCELYYRAGASGLTNASRLSVPISLIQLGETLGMSIATVNRSIRTLRASTAMEFQDGVLWVRDWSELKRLAEFDPHYLHLRKTPRV